MTELLMQRQDVLQFAPQYSSTLKTTALNTRYMVVYPIIIQLHCKLLTFFYGRKYKTVMTCSVPFIFHSALHVTKPVSKKMKYIQSPQSVKRRFVCIVDISNSVFQCPLFVGYAYTDVTDFMCMVFLYVNASNVIYVYIIHTYIHFTIFLV